MKFKEYINEGKSPDKSKALNKLANSIRNGKIDLAILGLTEKEADKLADNILKGKLDIDIAYNKYILKNNKKHMNEEEVLVVDYQDRPESVLNKIMKKYKAKVKDWQEDEYGLKLIINVPSNKIHQFKSEVNNTKGYTVED